jgi:hypothetical protein
MRPRLHPALGHLRLRAQQVDAGRAGTLAGVVHALGAVQAQDLGAVKWAVGLRVPTTVQADVERALDDGAVLRTHALRGTWQLVAPADLWWLLDLVRARILAAAATRYRQLGLHAALVSKALRVLDRAVDGERHLTRAELSQALRRANLPATGSHLSHLVQHAELEGLLCSGVARGVHVTWTRCEARAGKRPPALRRDEALAELARRYFSSRGPATLDDFTWWSGLTVSDATKAFEAVRGALAHEDGRWWAPSARARPAPAAPAHLLPAFDEFLIGYRDRDAVLDPRDVKRVNAGGGLLAPCVVVDGVVRGTWRRTLPRSGVDVALTWFTRPTRREADAVESAVARYGAFLGRDARVTSRRVLRG